jgi:hypothetical protein
MHLHLLCLYFSTRKQNQGWRETYSDLTEQIREREHFLNNVAKEEEILERTFCQAAEAELEKQLASRRDYYFNYKNL